MSQGNTEEIIDPGAWTGSCPVPILDHKEIVLGHGSGGKLTRDLIQKLFQPLLANEWLSQEHDGAIISLRGMRLAFSTDSFVVSPIAFPGGNIGDLAVNGTVNDLAMCGARPLYLSAAFIIEEGLPIDELTRVICSIQQAAKKADISIVTGDTKVVDRGKADRIFINTAGIGIIEDGIDIRPERAQPGDVVLVNGPIGEHGMAIMSVREGLEYETSIQSDTAALHGLVAAMLNASKKIHVLRDPTRGGVASALNEIAQKAHVVIRIEESRLPIRDGVKGACEILGLDPLYVANEGRLLAFVPPDDAESVLAAMRAHPCGEETAAIGQVIASDSGRVLMRTRIGGMRIVDMLSGDQLPRIC